MQSTSHADRADVSDPQIVAAVYSPATLRAAQALGPLPAAPDLLELRVDGFSADASRSDALDALAARSVRPQIVTVRHPAEGGLDPALGPAERRRLFERFLPWAAWIDVEVRSLGDLGALVASTRAGGTKLIASFHDFAGTPPADELRRQADRARAAGADVCKVATTTRTPGELARLLDLLEYGRSIGLPVAAMGMGPLGKVSRLALGAAGSVFCYGFLGETSQVPGQWPVEVLKARLQEM